MYSTQVNKLIALQERIFNISNKITTSVQTLRKLLFRQQKTAVIPTMSR